MFFKPHLFYFILLICFIQIQVSCRNKTPDIDYSASDTGQVAHPDHIIFVWLENKGVNKIIHSPEAPFINSLLKRGTLFSNSFALTHPSYPNYIRFFCGQTIGISSNSCITGRPFNQKNLYSVLSAVHKSFAWYSEGLPSEGSEICASDYYVERHNPVTIFSNVPAFANKPFSLFPLDYDSLENVVCVTPNLRHDMHDGSISQGDDWLKNNFSDLIDWCFSHNSVFIIYYDESESDAGNKIPVIALGNNVKQNFISSNRYDHYSWCKTIALMFGAEFNWTDNLKRSRRVNDCWK